MSYINALLTDPVVLVSSALLVLAFAFALLRRPENPISRKYAIWGLWALCFGVIATSAMTRQSQVLASSNVSDSSRPVAVSIKGTVRYVNEELAYRHMASMWVLLGFGLAFAAAHKVARIGNEA